MSAREWRLRKATMLKLKMRPAVAVSRWSDGAGKRLFDMVLAALLLVMLGPLMLLIAAVVKMTSRGPVLFRQQRLGRHGESFEIFKFRTMEYEREEMGPPLTTAADTRLTRAGRILRKWKLDELPQLANILRGEMSFVGPRPKLAHLELRRAGTLAVRPGVTGMATLAFRKEELLLEGLSKEQIETFYLETIAPLKVQLDLVYMRRATLGSDLRLILQTGVSVVWPLKKIHFSSREQLLRSNRRFIGSDAPAYGLASSLESRSSI